MLQHSTIERWKAAKSDSFDTVLTAILQQKLDEKTRLKWSEFSSEHESVPPCTELLKFLDLQARQLESVTQVGVLLRSESVLTWSHFQTSHTKKP